MTYKPGRRPVSRRLDAQMRSWVYQTSRRQRPRVSPLADEPEPHELVERAVRLVSWVLAVVAPLLVSAALVTVRSEIDRSTATLVLVLPVVLVAMIGGRGPAALAALVAPLAFDVLLTQPHYRLEINAAEDVEATVILLVVGVLVGQLVAREVRSRMRSEARGSEVEGLVGMVDAVVDQVSGPDLIEQATAALSELLDLRECSWSPGRHEGAYPRLTRSGKVSGRGATTEDLAPLPATGVTLPVTARNQELGRLLLVPSGPKPISREERAVAVAIADVLGLALVGADGGSQR